MNLTNRSNLFVSFFALIIFASCATPQNIIRMKPVSEEVTWNYGQAYASDTVSGVIVEAAFDNATSGYNVFDVRIINKSDMDYLVDPTSFYFEDVTLDTVNVQLIKAIDPEYKLLSIDKEISKSEADSKNAKIGAGIAAGALMAASVAVALTVDEPHYRHNNDVFVTTPIIFDGDDGNDYETPYVNQKREMWASSTIRKTTLKPGFKIEGKMFFPRFEKSGTYLFKVPVDDLEIEIPFMQIIYNPALVD